MKSVVVIAVAGGTGSGKTMMVKGICDEVGRVNVALLQQDNYYRDRSNLPVEERDKINFDHPEAFDSELLFEHLDLLRKRKSVASPVYDFCRHIRCDETEIVEPRDVVILEGILILANAAIRELLDLKIFVDTDDDTRFIRRLRRDIAERGRSVASVIEQYEQTVKPMHRDFVEPSKKYADIILPGSESVNVGIQVILGYIRGNIRNVKGPPW